MTQAQTKLFSKGSYFREDAPSAPFAWYGGKAYYAEWIIDQFPSHRVFVEPFGGAANILLRKHESEVEVFNDLDGRIVNFFSVLRDRERFEELRRLVSLTPYSREVFRKVIEQPEPHDSVERAWWFFVRCRQSVGGIGMSRLTASGWAVSLRTRRQMAEPVSKYLSAIDGLEDVATRFRSVLIEQSPAVDLIRKHDAKDVLFYCDPPYLAETRHGSQARTYGHEMEDAAHEELLDVLRGCKGKVLLSGYPSDLYDRKLRAKKWKREEFETKAHMANSGETRIEVLWRNF